VKAGALDAWMLDIAGIPIGLKGHSRHFAWGWSEGPRHPSDCISVPINPANAAEYLFDGKARPFEAHPYKIAVKGAAAVEGVFEYTHHNGVRSEVIRREAASALVVSNAYMGREGFARDEFGEMLHAKDWRGIRNALGRRDIYPANIIIAGSDGSILYMRPGRTPERAPGTEPKATVDGSTSATAWRGIYPLDKLVQTFDPLQGFLTNENVSPDMMFAEPFFDPAAYSKDFALVPGDTGTRQLRAIELFRGTRKFSFNDLRAFVADPVIAGFERFGMALNRATPSSKDTDYIAFRDQLIGFDGRYVPKSRAALYHASWRIQLRESFSGEATAIEIAVGRGRALSPAQLSTLEAAAAATFPRLRAEPGGLARVFGDRFRIGRGAVSAPARGLTLLPGADDKSGETEFGSLWGANYTKGADGNYHAQGQTRFPFLVQFTTPIRSLSVTAYGVSDDPKSPHYSDQSQHMGDGNLHSNFFDSADLAGAVQLSATLKTGK
jgi:acyl-homoserine-lactone acylase